MKILFFNGSDRRDLTTLKRLLLIADEICFACEMNAGTYTDTTVFVRRGSPASDNKDICAMAGGPIKVTELEGPPDDNSLSDIQDAYVVADLKNLDFRSIVIDGLRTTVFPSKFIPDKRDIPETVWHVGAILAADAKLLTLSLGNPLDFPPRFLRLSDRASRIRALNWILSEISRSVTNIMVISSELGVLPVTDDPYLVRLLALRSSDASYVGGTSRISPLLGLEIAKTVIPDQALQKLEVQEILEYRRKTKDVFKGWSIELNRLAARLDDLRAVDIEKILPKLIATEVQPQLLEYQNEMKAAAERLFGRLLKRVAPWPLPVLSLAHFADLSFPAAIAAFAGSLSLAIPTIVDYFLEKRAIARKHAVSYLVGIGGYKS